MGTCQGQRNDDCSSSLGGCSPHTAGKPLGQRRESAPLTFPVPVVCPFQCYGLRGRHSAPRSVRGPSAEPEQRAAQVRERGCQQRATPETPRRFRRGAARCSGLPSEALRGGPSACGAAFWAARARRPRTPRAGRGRGGRSPPAAPSRPGPEGATGLRSRAPEVTSAPPADPAQRRTAPSSKASAPPPTSQPRRQLRGTCPAAGGRRAAGAEPASGTAPIAPTGEGRDFGQDGARLLVRRSGACPYASRSSVVGWERYVAELLTWPWIRAKGLLGTPGSRKYRWRVTWRASWYRTRVPNIVTHSPTHPSPLPLFFFFLKKTTQETVAR
jgi:hypothetical protein